MSDGKANAATEPENECDDARTDTEEAEPTERATSDDHDGARNEGEKCVSNITVKKIRVKKRRRC
jgi:hypothetical protein